ncbi:hypothetical protein OLX02_04880 [Novosphingobium sp. KCTC 2891]|uniref:hypothetical protein n=1 Tax=Novosphingobium sp. KCTC 2891 TaxID=2989730 RepID=UPI0022230124|nr:hypothetical protein [Novosphingobium sp. KCTC 2891]MCW1382148.1 hypothetical protein [Novosphingobium sp. KCTC 2891]
MIALPLLLLGIDVPDPAPALEAVKACDRVEMRSLIRGEPHRRTKFAAAAYAEQRAIAQERSTVLSGPSSTTPSGQVTTGTALAQLDGRQKQLDDARATEKSWRDLFDEVRADYLANCTTGKRNADD